MSADTPDLTAILDDLYIGNLASAKTLRDHPELGITHVLSVCPDYPEASIAASGITSDSAGHCPTVAHPKHRCISIQDSEYEDILVHLPSAVTFIRDALGESQTHLAGADEDAERGGDSRPYQEGSSLASARKHRVLVHCVMGISRSTTVVCAYLMATRHISPSAALMFIRKRRPLAHPNYGFRRQLAIFADCGYFENHHGPVRSHPAHAAWMRKRNREAKRFLARLDDVVEIKFDSKENGMLSITDDFPTDSTEAACLLSEVEVTHFLSISPASMPALPPSEPAPTVSPNKTKYNRPLALACPPMSSASSSGSGSGSGSSPSSAFSSPLSSRSSSFSFASHLSGLSTAATSLVSLPSLTPLSKLRSEASFESSDDEADEEPTFLALAGVKHYHLEVPSSSPADPLFRLKEGASFIRRALEDDADHACGTASDSDSDCETKSASEKGLSGNYERDPEQRKHVLIHSTTESRACAVMCAYLMSSRGLTPLQAYSFLEDALPLFNPTKSFLKQLELFHACEYNPTPEHPLVRAWLSGSSVSAASALASFTGPGRPQSRMPVSTHWKSDSDVEGDSDVFALRRKLGTPARCGSFAGPSPYAKSNVSASASASASKSESESSASGGRRSVSGSGSCVPALACPGSDSGPAPASVGVHPQPVGTGELEALLQRCEGVGDPGFAFDVEAFRGALRGIAAHRDANGADRNH